MKACSIQRYDKNRDVIGIYIYIVCLSQFLKIYLVQYKILPYFFLIQSHIFIIFFHILTFLNIFTFCVQPSITGWYCQCKVGARTIGCCAHVAAVLWYLGHQRHVADTISLPTDHSRHFLNAADVDWNSDDSDIGF